MDPDTIDIDVEDRTITIRAERKAPAVGKDDEWISRERTFGRADDATVVGDWTGSGSDSIGVARTS